MNKRQWYYKQVVTEGEMDQAFDWVESAMHSVTEDENLTGLLQLVGTEWIATETAPQSMSAQVAGPGYAYDKDGKRCVIAAAATEVNCGQDEYGVPTTVVGGGNERWVTIFLRFLELDTVPEVDGNGLLVYTELLESAELVVRQGAEAAAGFAVRPAALADGLIVADVLLTNGMVVVTNADIYQDRTEWWYTTTTTKWGDIADGNAKAALDTIWAALDGYVTELATSGAPAGGAQSVGARDYTTGGAHVAWASDTVQGALEEIADVVDAYIGLYAETTSDETISGDWDFTGDFVHAPAGAERAIFAGTSLDVKTLRGGSISPAMSWDYMARRWHDNTYGLVWGRMTDQQNTRSLTSGGFDALCVDICTCRYIPAGQTGNTVKRQNYVVVLDAGLSPVYEPRIFVFDPWTGSTLFTKIDIPLATLPAGNWAATAMCSDGTYLYIMFMNGPGGAEAHRIQAYDLVSTPGSLTRRASWPATGYDHSTAVGTGQNPEWGANVAGGESLMKDRIIIAETLSPKLVTLNSWIQCAAANSPAVSVLDPADPTNAPLHGAGNSATVQVDGYGDGALCSDFAGHVFFSTCGTDPQVCALLLSDPTNAVVGLANTPQTFEGRVKDVQFDGTNVWANESYVAVNGNDLSIYRLAEQDWVTLADTSTLKLGGGHLCFDGVNMWVQSVSKTSGQMFLIPCKVGAFGPDTIQDLSELAGRKQHYLLPAEYNKGDSQGEGRMAFDGDGVWTICDWAWTGGLTNPTYGKVRRVPRAWAHG